MAEFAAAHSVGFVGLGKMGLPMALSLQREVFRVRGFDLSKPALRLARDSGLEVAASLEAVTKDAGFIVSHAADRPTRACLSRCTCRVPGGRPLD